MSPSTSTTVYLEATYTSPNTSQQPQTISSTPLSLPGSADLTVENKTAYLSSLRKATVAMQEQINAELTKRMEEDNRNASAGALNAGSSAKTTKGAVADEVAEEENYGEEVVDGEDEI
ncbi:hypothetical protein GGS20DRAFT_365407 [Poronia punctata]|nr:hypothetical protein GGS20DRAFT_365407 [Poronia punctata]